MARRSDDWSGARMAMPDGAAGGPAEFTGLARQSTSRRDAGRVLRVLALVAVAIGLAVLTAAACVLSYGSIHSLATVAGISAPLARIYPLIFDAMLVLAGCAVLALRGAGLVSRLYGWLCFLVLLGSLAAGGVVHVAAVTIPRRPAEIAAAIVPFALVLVGFGLLLALLRHARLRSTSRRHGWPDTGASSGTTVQGRLAIPGMPAAPPTALGGTSGPVKIEPVKLAVRTTDMQLRARVPRQPATGDKQTDAAQPASPAAGGPADAGEPGGQADDQAVPDHPEPFMPPVGQHKEQGQAVRARRTNPRLSKGSAPDGTSRSVPDSETTEPRPDTGKASAAPTSHQADMDVSGARPASDDPPAADGPDAGSSVTQPPAFDRPRSSPTPPEG